jgi:hypothetical protein
VAICAACMALPEAKLQTLTPEQSRQLGIPLLVEQRRRFGAANWRAKRKAYLAALGIK